MGVPSGAAMSMPAWPPSPKKVEMYPCVGHMKRPPPLGALTITAWPSM